MIASIGVHLFESTAFAIVSAMLAFLMRRRSAAARYTIWLCAVAKFAIPAAVLSEAGVFWGYILPAHTSLTFQYSSFYSTLYSLPKMSAATVSGGVSHHFLGPVLAIVWLIGFAIVSGLWIYRSLEVQRELEDVTVAERDLLEQVRRNLGIRRTVALKYSSPGRDALGLWGILHPTIRLPKGLSSQLTPAEFEAVLLHELSHVHRSDNVCGAFVHLVVCVFWFHPLLWWLERRVLVERERACDEMVIGSGTRPETYVAGILKVCRFQLTDAVAGASGMSRSDLKNRMELIMAYRPMNRSSMGPRLVLGLLASSIIMVPFAAGVLQQSALHAETMPNVQQAATRDSTSVCVYDSVKYRLGTVVQMGSRARECSRGSWIPTSRTATIFPVVKLPAPCRVQVSISANACMCQDGQYSLGAITRSVNQTFIRCDRFEIGKFTTWRPATPSELGR